MSRQSRTSGRRTMMALLALVILLAGTGAGLWALGFFEADDPFADSVFVQVREGPLVISVTESGTIRSRDQVVLINEVEGRTTIIYLIEEGQHVEKGELLVELDSSGLQDRLVEQEIRVENADAAMVRAREGLEVTLSQGRSDIARAELDYRFAQDDLVKYKEGDFPKQRLEMENRIALARAELQRAAETLNWSRRFLDEQLISATEFERDQIAHNRAKIDVELAQTDLNLLLEYTNRRRLAELESNVVQAEMALDRIRRRANADEVQARADLRAREADFRTQQMRLERMKDQIEKSRIYAPSSGMVVYPTTGQTRWGSNVEPLSAGQEVRERQELIHLPSPGSLIAEIKIHESVLDKVRPGQRVMITVDALPDRRFEGRVARIAPLPDASSMFMNPDLKVYNTVIEIQGQPTDLRTGMSCRAEIIVETFEQAKAVPIQAVVRVDDRPTVYVLERGRLEPRQVRLGLDNQREVRILDGLARGEYVSLTPPLASGERRLGGEPSLPPAEPTPSAAASGDATVPTAGQGPERSGENAGNDRGAMSPEDREAMRERMRNMTPEQREQLRQQAGRRGAGEGGQRPARPQGGDGA
ncbi:MAG: efflux RND transporter periplasmic adaptor subunit [Phycisphaeraceae bacterium]|nr:efflux RND transporter periplasmic adaptor subunit [Phycisphaeraceae bacterium]